MILQISHDHAQDNFDPVGHVSGMTAVFRVPMFFTVLTLTVGGFTIGSLGAEEKLSFNRDVRPILAGNCYDCHGPDEETIEGDLRLDSREAAEEVLGVDGELFYRITTDDDIDLMPPPDSHRHLTEDQIETIRLWLEQGAPYETHWAFVAPEKAVVPEIQSSETAINPIDHFIRQRLEEENLKPSPEADRHTLVRRLYLDLIGIPPTPEQADAFVNSTDPKAYDKLVDELLASPRYGERWARPWLDLARYSDTNGYEKDRPRSIWPYRDWVVDAINADMPFDQFTIEQLAGDMLPNPTLEQLIATGFHRNTMLNEEGGIDPLEYRYYAMVDRVATTGTVWMGLSTGCAQCHTHKYDPITHTDYFSLMALLDNADEVAIHVPDADIEAQQALIDLQIREAEAELLTKIDPAQYEAWKKAEKAKVVPWHKLEPTKLKANLPLLEHEGDGIIFASGDFTKRDVYELTYQLPDELKGKTITALRLEALPDERLPAGGPGAAYYEGRSGDFFLSEVTLSLNDKPVEIGAATRDFGKIYIGRGDAPAQAVFDGKGSSGWSTASRENEPHELVVNLKSPLFAEGELKVELLFERHFVAALGKLRISVTTSEKTAAARTWPQVDPATASEEEMMIAYASSAKEMAKSRAPLEALKKKRPSPPTTMVMRERPPHNPRTTRRHHRGEYLNAEEEVPAAVPAVFPQLPEGEPANRLTFARWLVSEDNPLAARVVVNRAWQALFGRGIMESVDEFGTQSEAPSHPELLDWLAIEFMEKGWSRKELHRLIVSSATYRQDSDIRSDLLAADPDNILLTRGPRFRLDGEVVRDMILKASGLLSDKMGGPGVYPPQPASVAAAAYGNTKWPISTGEDRYRRSLYTWSKRTAPFAAFTVFDAPTGEICVAKRDRSNSPLQALTLLNDAMFVEMAEAAASEAMANHEDNEAIVTDLFRRFLTRPPNSEEQSALLSYFESQRQRFEKGELSATEWLGEDNSSSDLAAWALVARALMNLDETITKG